MHASRDASIPSLYMSHSFLESVFYFAKNRYLIILYSKCNSAAIYWFANDDLNLTREQYTI